MVAVDSVSAAVSSDVIPTASDVYSRAVIDLVVMVPLTGNSDVVAATESEAPSEEGMVVALGIATTSGTDYLMRQ